LDAIALKRELEALAAHLRARRPALLRAWSDASAADPALTTASTLSRAQFLDHMPALLEALERRLGAWDMGSARAAARDERLNAEGHGLQRWQQGYDEREVMREWVWLDRCLAEEIGAYVSGKPDVPAPAIAAAWTVISDLLVRGMSESVRQYEVLQRADAMARLRALEDAHAALTALEQQRAHAWREATHDLRGNVSIVHNVTALLKAQGTQTSALGHSLTLLERSVRALQTLLDDLTAQARLDAGREQREVAPFDAAHVLAEMCAASRSIAQRRGLALECSGPATLPVEGDAVKVQRIAQNLLLNALHYTDRGGICVTWEPIGAKGERWALTVQDTGPGMPSPSAAPLATALDAATKLGEGWSTVPPAPTARAQGARSGGDGHEGLGLAIVKRLCELVDASLELVSAPGRGTTFHVSFPARYPKG
jgi:signal transduction histidine kinase